MEKPFADIGKRLKETRLEEGLEPKDVAEKMNVDVFLYRAYERGDRKISTEAAKKYGAIFGVSSDFIYYGSGGTMEAEKLWEKYTAAPEHIQMTINQLLGLGEDK